jgi:hypothetical protein
LVTGITSKAEPIHASRAGLSSQVGQYQQPRGVESQLLRTGQVSHRTFGNSDVE